jgi:predicted TIM-barrel fold metal-dependent hydrolase
MCGTSHANMRNFVKSLLLLISSIALLTAFVFGQQPSRPAGSPELSGPPAVQYTGPIIDVHLHTDPPRSAAGLPNPVTGAKPAATSEELRDAVIEQCKRYNIVRAVINGRPANLPPWTEKDPHRFIPAPMIIVIDQHPVIDIPTLRSDIQSGRAAALGEIMAQYMGLEASDPILEPYWALAEELNVPAMIHTGTSFPGTAFHGYPLFRLRFGRPLLLEDVLVKHPKLRLWMAHGGGPWTDEAFALMAQYRQVYTDVSALDWIGGPAGQARLHAFLKEAIDRGLEKRVMFGTDEAAWPDAIPLAIAGVDSVPLLTPEQKRDIFYNNAATFLQLHDTK